MDPIDRTMISPTGSIDEFLPTLIGRPFEVVKQRIKEEKRAAEAVAKRASLAGDRATADPMFDYTQSLRCLLYWLTRVKRPRNCGAFESFRPVTESLVARGTFPPGVLDAFGAGGRGGG